MKIKTKRRNIFSVKKIKEKIYPNTHTHTLLNGRAKAKPTAIRRFSSIALYTWISIYFGLLFCWWQERSIMTTHISEIDDGVERRQQPHTLKMHHGILFGEPSIYDIMEWRYMYISLAHRPSISFHFRLEHFYIFFSCLTDIERKSYFFFLFCFG